MSLDIGSSLESPIVRAVLAVLAAALLYTLGRELRKIEEVSLRAAHRVHDPLFEAAGFSCDVGLALLDEEAAGHAIDRSEGTRIDGLRPREHILAALPFGGIARGGVVAQPVVVAPVPERGRPGRVRAHEALPVLIT